MDRTKDLDPKRNVSTRGNLGFSVDGPTYSKASPKGYVKYLKFRTCIYNVEDLKGVMIRPYRVSDTEGTTLIGVIDVTPIDCTDYEVKISTDKDGKIIYG